MTDDDSAVVSSTDENVVRASAVWLGRVRRANTTLDGQSSVVGNELQLST